MTSCLGPKRWKSSADGRRASYPHRTDRAGPNLDLSCAAGGARPRGLLHEGTTNYVYYADGNLLPDDGPVRWTLLPGTGCSSRRLTLIEQHACFRDQLVCVLLVFSKCVEQCEDCAEAFDWVG